MNHDRTPSSLVSLAGAVALFTVPSLAAAQDTGASGGGDPGGGGSPNVTVVQVPAPSAPAAAPAWNPDGHLPSSSRSVTDTSRSSDGFDFGGAGAGAGPVRGGANSTYVVEGSYVPEAHSVRRGDTLWEISQHYYQNAYFWPRVWSLNPQVQNPHWIYPGDRIRLRDGGAQRGSTFQLRRSTVAPQTVFIREVGYVDDPTKDTWGEIVGSPNDHVILTDTRDLYIQLDDKRDVQIGQELTIFHPLKVDVRDASGELVSIRGTARVDRYNPKTHMVRAQVIESIDTIERGAKVGPVGRRFEVVPPKVAEQDLDAGIATALFPHQFWGQQQIVFLNKGSEDGVKPGNRFFAIERGDRWARDRHRAGRLAKQRPRIEDDRWVRADDVDLEADQDLFPDETYAEFRVIHVREHTAMCLITSATHEIERDALLVMRRGF
jgi:hypothetical protein